MLGERADRHLVRAAAVGADQDRTGMQRAAGQHIVAVALAVAVGCRVADIEDGDDADPGGLVHRAGTVHPDRQVAAHIQAVVAADVERVEAGTVAADDQVAEVVRGGVGCASGGQHGGAGEHRESEMFRHFFRSEGPGKALQRVPLRRSSGRLRAVGAQKVADCKFGCTPIRRAGSFPPMRTNLRAAGTARATDEEKAGDAGFVGCDGNRVSFAGAGRQNPRRADRRASWPSFRVPGSETADGRRPGCRTTTGAVCPDRYTRSRH